MSDSWDSGYKESVYNVWYKGEFAGSTTDAQSVGVWTLGKIISKIKITKDDVEVPLIGFSGSSNEIVKIIESFDPSIMLLDGDLFEI